MVESINPFKTSNEERTYRNILDGNFSFSTDENRWIKSRPPLSDSIKDLIGKILQPDPRNRPSLDQITSHRFFTDPEDRLPIYALPHSLP
jgi:serine/threonine protein kinase